MDPAERKHVLLLESIDEAALTSLEARTRVHSLETPRSPVPDEVAARVHAMITRGSGPIPADLIDRSPRLQVIGRCGVGVDNIDLEAASRRSIPVINAPGSTTLSTAEHTIALMLAVTRRLHSQACAVTAGEWDARLAYDGDECAGRSLGIIGLGSIGRRVARVAAALDMNVFGWNRSPIVDPPCPLKPFEEVIAQADVVSLHTALTPETAGLVSDAVIRTMRPGAVLVNTARGALVDAAAVRGALDDGRLAGYAADVTAPEPPPPDDPLVGHPRVVITPHNAALTRSTFRRMCVRTIENVLACLEGRDVDRSCVVNASGLAP